MDKGYFIKAVTDTNKLNGFFMDDYTAGLLYDRFLDMSESELTFILERLLGQGEKVTYRAIKANRKEKMKFEKKEEEVEIITECEEDCKKCKRHTAACQKMNVICNDMLKKITGGIVAWRDGIKMLHELFPNAGFNKKIGKVVGVMLDENGEHISVYRYDDM